MRYAGEALTGALLGLLAATLALVLTGCTSLTPAKVASNGLQSALDAEAEILTQECVTPYAMTPSTPAEADRQEAAYQTAACPRRLRAYDNARRIGLALHAVVGAYELGECSQVARSLADCDLAGAVADALEVAELVRQRMAGGQK